jgi:hypothetical protein
MNTRRRSGQQTERSVLNIWKVGSSGRNPSVDADGRGKRWLTATIASGEVPDMIIDAHHIIQYLKYTGTRKLLTRSGSEKNTSECLSAVCAQTLLADD